MTRREVPHPQSLPGRTLGIVADDIEGDVVDIGARGTKVLTNDNIAIIVPNSKSITENVVNWKYNDASVRGERHRDPVPAARSAHP